MIHFFGVMLVDWIILISCFVRVVAGAGAGAVAAVDPCRFRPALAFVPSICCERSP